jgi:hypothetical protein
LIELPKRPRSETHVNITEVSASLGGLNSQVDPVEFTEPLCTPSRLNGRVRVGELCLNVHVFRNLSVELHTQAGLDGHVAIGPPNKAP